MDRWIAQIGDASSIDEVVQILRSSARRLVGADGVAVILRDGDHCHYVDEDAIGPLWKGQRFPLETCVSGWAMIHRKTAVIPDILVDARIPQDAYRDTFVRSMVMVPIGEPEPMAAIGAYWASATRPAPDDLEALERLARSTGEALKRLGAARPQSRSRPRATGLSDGRDGLAALDRLLPRRSLPFLPGLLLALALVGGLTLFRIALTPILGAALVYTMFMPAILAAALWGGPVAGAAAIIAGMAGGALVESSAGIDNADTRAATWFLFGLTGALIAAVGTILRRILDRERDHGERLEQRDWQMSQVTRELDHRSRNVLSVVLALVEQAARSADTPDSMRAALSGRLHAMKAAQQNLLDSGTSEPMLGRLLYDCLAPYIESGRLTIDVAEDIPVPPGGEVMLCLAFNELATNSCKYGSLSVADGEVRLIAAVDGGFVELEWVESGGPLVRQPEVRGTGARLIERALSGVPQSRVSIDYLPAGLVCRMRWGTPAEVRSVSRKLRSVG